MSYPSIVVSQSGGEVVDSWGLKWRSIGCIDHGDQFVEAVVDVTGDYLAIVPHETMEVIIVFGPHSLSTPEPGDEGLFDEAIRLYELTA